MTEKLLSYQLVDLPNTDYTCIKLLKPPFEGLIYYYQTVKFRKMEENGEETAKVTFTYKIIDQGKAISDISKPEFKNLLGDILMDILEDTLGNGLKEVDKAAPNNV